ncbi:MAG: hypothetical protein U1F61_30890 [Opitutaceae bacterium]
MRTFLRLHRKVHFPASVRAMQRRWQRLTHPLRALCSKRRLPLPVTVDSLPLCSAENCNKHHGLSQQHALWLVSLRPWAAAISRRLGLRGTEIDDSVQNAFTAALSSWNNFVPTPDRGNIEQRRLWLGRLVWSAVSKVRAQRGRSHLVANPEILRTLLHASCPSHEDQLVARSVLATLQQATTPERWRAWAACKVEQVPAREVARREGRPSATIYNLVRLAEQDFQAALRREAAVGAGPFVSRYPRKVRQ